MKIIYKSIKDLTGNIYDRLTVTNKYLRKGMINISQAKQNEIYYTVTEVALMLKVSKSYVYDLVNYRHLGAIKLSKRRTRISKESLDRFLNNQKEDNQSYNYVAQPPTRRRINIG